MPNKKGGKKYKKGKKTTHVEKELIEKNDKMSEEYGIITKKLGNGRFTVICFDSVERMAIISGKLRKRVWMEIGNVVLLAKWDFQDEKCSIIHKYEEMDINKLIKNGGLTQPFINKNTCTSNADDIICDEDDYFDRNLISDDSESESDSESSDSLEEPDKKDEAINIDDI